jgi:hypothetical protein
MGARGYFGRVQGVERTGPGGEGIRVRPDGHGWVVVNGVFPYREAQILALRLVRVAALGVTTATHGLRTPSCV